MIRLRPSYLPCLRVVHVYPLSVMDFVFEAMPPWEDWPRKAQVLLHRVPLACIVISQLLPLALLYGVSGLLGFYLPFLFLRYQLRYIKGLFVTLNSRSVYTCSMLRYIVLGV